MNFSPLSLLLHLPRTRRAIFAAAAVVIVVAAACFTVAVRAADFSSSSSELKTRLWPTAEKTRLVIETSPPPAYQIFQQTNPPRLILDIADSDTAAEAALAFLAAADMRGADYLGGMRAVRQNRATLRLSFSLRENVRHRARILPPVAGYAHRLILDILPENNPDPLLALIESLQKDLQKELELEKEKGGDNTAPKSPPFLVLIDPGHGGEDPGAVGGKNFYEKDIVLAISKKVKEEIDRRPGMRALLSRSDDRFLPLVRRVQIAHQLGVDAFVSVHADSVANSKPRGSSVFVLSARGASSRFAKRLARDANLSDLIGGDDGHDNDPALRADLLPFSRDGKDRASRQLASLLQSNIAEINTLHGRHVESAGFAVLKSPSIPSVLVETAFISNPSEARKLRDPGFQRKMAAAIANGLQQYQQRYEVADDGGAKN